MKGYKFYLGTSEKVKIRVIIRFNYLQSTTAEVSLHESPPHFARPERLTRVKVQVFVACSIFVASRGEDGGWRSSPLWWWHRCGVVVLVWIL